MATMAEWQALRDDIGYPTLTDEEAEALYVQAATLYSAGAVYAGARVLTILRLLGPASQRSDYVQNNSAERSSQTAASLRELLKIWQGFVDAAVTAESAGGSTRLGGLRRRPAKVKEYPDDPGHNYRGDLTRTWWW